MIRMSRTLAFKILMGVVLISLAGSVLIRGVRNLAMTRKAVTSYARLIVAGNVGDLAMVRSLCSSRYLETHPLEVAQEGGVVGFPRQIHPNYQVWVEGADVWLCSGNRMGQVVRFVSEAGAWKYDGLAGMLRGDGRVEPMGGEADPSREKP